MVRALAPDDPAPWHGLQHSRLGMVSLACERASSRLRHRRVYWLSHPCNERSVERLAPPRKRPPVQRNPTRQSRIDLRRCGSVPQEGARGQSSHWRGDPLFANLAIVLLRTPLGGVFALLNQPRSGAWCTNWPKLVAHKHRKSCVSPNWCPPGLQQAAHPLITPDFFRSSSSAPSPLEHRGPADEQHKYGDDHRGSNHGNSPELVRPHPPPETSRLIWPERSEPPRSCRPDMSR